MWIFLRAGDRSFNGRTAVDVELRIKAIEERLSEVETARRNEGSIMQQILELVTRIDANMSSIAGRVQALETNYSLMNAELHTVGQDVRQILELMRSIK